MWHVFVARLVRTENNGIIHGLNHKTILKLFDWLYLFYIGYVWIVFFVVNLERQNVMHIPAVMWAFDT